MNEQIFLGKILILRILSDLILLHQEFVSISYNHFAIPASSCIKS
jgi:hypothetical protein